LAYEEEAKGIETHEIEICAQAIYSIAYAFLAEEERGRDWVVRNLSHAMVTKFSNLIDVIDEL